MKREELAAELDDLAALGDVDGLKALSCSVDGAPASAAAAARRLAVAARLAGRIADALCYERDSERYLAQVPA